MKPGLTQHTDGLWRDRDGKVWLLRDGVWQKRGRGRPRKTETGSPSLTVASKPPTRKPPTRTVDSIVFALPKTADRRTDFALIRAAQAGDRAAENALIDRYAGFAAKLSQEFFAPGVDYDDFRQEALIGLAKAIRRYDPERRASFKSYAALSIQRQVITAVKTARRKKHEMLSHAVRTGSRDGIKFGEDREDFDMVDVLIDADSDPHDVLDRNEKLRAVIDALRYLSPLEREAIFAIANGVTYQEIAETLGCTTKSIDNAVQRVRRKARFAVQAADAA